MEFSPQMLDASEHSVSLVRLWTDKVISYDARPHINTEALLGIAWYGILLAPAWNIVVTEDPFMGKRRYTYDKNTTCRVYDSHTLLQIPPTKCHTSRIIFWLWLLNALQMKWVQGSSVHHKPDTH